METVVSVRKKNLCTDVRTQIRPELQKSPKITTFLLFVFKKGFVCTFMGLLLFCVYVVMIADEMRTISDCAVSLQFPAHRGCNRVDNLCSERYDETVYTTMHNSFANTQNHNLITQHRGCMRSALNRGIWSFMLDVHMNFVITLHHVTIRVKWALFRCQLRWTCLWNS